MTRQNEYFFLDSYYILHKGFTGYAIYDLYNGGMITVNRELGSILEDAENGNTIEKISQDTQLDNQKVAEILSPVIKKNMGNFYSTRIYIEKYKIGPPYIRYSLHATGIQRCFIELPGDCQVNCSFCNSPTLFPCNRCMKVLSQPSLKHTKEFLNRMFLMNCKAIIFHGGDPISSIQQFTSIIKYCRTHNYDGEIYVITNGTQINNTIMNLFAKYHIYPVIPIFSNALVVTESRLKEISRLAHDLNVLYILTDVILETNPDISTQKDLISSLKPLKTWKSVVYNNNHDGNRKFYPTLLNTTLRVIPSTYYHTKWLHPCLWGTIALSANGDILPCPHLKSKVLGNIYDSYCIEKIFESDNIIFNYWELNLSRISHCQDCEYKYGCLDCRALETHISDNLHDKHVCSLGKLT